MDSQTRNELIQKIDQRISPQGYLCVEVEWEPAENALRVFIDRPDGGPAVLMEDCVKVSKLLEEEAFLDNAIPSAYNLEISSPGVERPLRRLSDFERHVGKRVKAAFYEEVSGRKMITGTIEEATENQVVVANASGVRCGFRLDNLHHARLVYDWKRNGRGV